MVDPLDLLFVMSHHMGAGSWAQVLYKTNRCFYLPSHLSGPHCLVQALEKLHKRRAIIIPTLQTSGVKGLKLMISAVGIIYLTSFDFMKIVSHLSLLSSSNFLSCRAVLLGRFPEFRFISQVVFYGFMTLGKP